MPSSRSTCPTSRRMILPLPSFNPAFLGLAVMLVWTQCMLYARYLWVDAGFTTIAINYVRCGFIDILAAIALTRRFTERFQSCLCRFSVVLMTVASLLFYLMGFFEEPSTLMFAAIVCAGVGVTWGEGAWIKVYMRLTAHEALFYALCSLAAFSCAGLFVGLIPEPISFLVGMLLPMVAYLMYGRAMKTLDIREGREAPAVPAAVDDAYAAEPRSSLVRVLVGIALFSFVMGMSRGFPYGTSIQIGQKLQMVQHLVLIFVALVVMHGVLAQNRRLRFAVLWEIQLSAMAVGVLLLSTYDATLTALGATVMAVANLCQVVFLWLTVIDFARHRECSAFHALAVVWFCHLFFRETGRLTIIGVTAWGAMDSALILAILIGLIVVCMALMLTGPVPRVRPLFADFCAMGEGEEARKFVNETATQPSGDESVGRQADARVRDCLTTDFGLTPRETDVAMLLAEGRSTPYVAHSLALAENTVRGYTKQVYEKLDVHSKQQLIDLIREI